MKIIILVLAIFFLNVSTPAFSQNKKTVSKKTVAKKTAAKKTSNKALPVSHNGKFSIGMGFMSVQTMGKTTSYYVNPRPPDTLGGITNSASPSKELISAYSEGKVGGYLFFDATYGEFDVSFSGSEGAGENWRAFEMGLGFYGKYLFKLGKTEARLGPIGGVQFDMVLAAWDSYNNQILNGAKTHNTNGQSILTGIIYHDQNEQPYSGNVIDLSNISLKIGLNGRVPFNTKMRKGGGKTGTQKFFFDMQYMWGYRFESVYEKHKREYEINKLKGSYDEIKKIDPFKSNLTLKLAFAYVF
ncbi:MAG: hypothetical protein Ta2G_08770 [Termitinemataceae bacterium]|nr:MAG: hypothetical protein Ta2G_08770 [Termitinemataceae bacterium]